MALEAINAAMPATIGGSADLTGSNNTKTKGLEPLTADNYGGRYIYYGIREFGMAAAMNGMALHGGVIPYGGTFLVFTDYARPGDPPSRAAEGPGHLRDDPRFDRAWRGRADAPADRASAEPAGDAAARRLSPRRRGRDRRMLGAGAGRPTGPSILALTRQNLRPVRTEARKRESLRARRLSAQDRGRRRKVILIATGSEVEIALDVAERLEAQGIGTDVVSMPCTERFDAQPPEYREDILPDVSNREILRVSIEAGTTFGWERYTGLHGLRIGIDRFGVSAPAKDAYELFRAHARQDHRPRARPYETKGN